MHGLVILDKDDQVIRPAILWNDGRTVSETDYLNQVIGKDKLSRYTANIAFAGFTAPKILWVRENEPENFARHRKADAAEGLSGLPLKRNLLHRRVPTPPAWLLFDVEHKCWSREMTDICGVKESQLARIFESYEAVGTLKPALAEELGLSEEVKIVAGAGDNAAAAVGTGTVGDGSCNISLGTSGTIFISSKKFGVDEDNALHSFGPRGRSFPSDGLHAECRLLQQVDGWMKSEDEGLRRRADGHRHKGAWKEPCLLSALPDGREKPP